MRLFQFAKRRFQESKRLRSTLGQLRQTSAKPVLWNDDCATVGQMLPDERKVFLNHAAVSSISLVGPKVVLFEAWTPLGPHSYRIRFITHLDSLAALSAPFLIVAKQVKLIRISL